MNKITNSIGTVKEDIDGKRLERKK